MQYGRRRAVDPRKFDTGPVYLTQAGFDRLKDRLARLKTSLPAIIEEAQRTAAYGDRSDNAEYKEAKGILRRTHRQIFAAEDQIKRVVIIKTGPNESNTVHLGSTVTLEIEGVQKTFEILGSPETNPTRGRISHTSPLGAALLEHKIGDEISLKTEKGLRKYRIIAVR